MSPWVLNVHIDAVLNEVEMGMGKMGVRFLEDGRKSEEYLASCMQMTLFCMASRKKNQGQCCGMFY